MRFALPILLSVIVLVSGCTTLSNPNNSTNPIQHTMESLSVNEITYNDTRLHVLFHTNNQDYQPYPFSGTLTVTLHDAERGPGLFKKGAAIQTWTEAISGTSYTDNRVSLTFDYPTEQTTQWGKGIVEVIFTAQNGKTFRRLEIVSGFPSQDLQRFKEQYENEYQENALELRRDKEISFVEITLLRMGHFTDIETQIPQEEKKFRIDFEIKNNAGFTNTLTFTGIEPYIKLDDKTYKWERTVYEGQTSRSSIDIEPHLTRRGYLLFTGLPSGTSGDAEIVVGALDIEGRGLSDPFVYFLKIVS